MLSQLSQYFLIQISFAKHKTMKVHQFPYSPNAAPRVFSSFPKQKIHLMDLRMEETIRNIIVYPHTISKEKFQAASTHSKLTGRDVLSIKDYFDENESYLLYISVLVNTASVSLFFNVNS